MESAVKEYLRELGRRGGRKSRRQLTSEEARRMVRIREARKAYRKFYASCFWSAPEDLRIVDEDVAWVVQNLRAHGGAEGWEVAEKLCR